MDARMTMSDQVMPGATAGIQQIYKAMYRGGADHSVLELVHLRVSQINGCSACVFAGNESAQKAGIPVDKLLQLAAWRESALFDEGERAALNLAEVPTRLADKGEAVSDEDFEAAADVFDEGALSAIILMIGVTNMFNRLNGIIREQAGKTW